MTATVVRITNIEPMDGYDSIASVTVLGWRVVATRNTFKIGDLGCYYSIGSVLPKAGPTEFLKGKPLKTKKFKNYISQGLLLPLDAVGLSDVVEGQDITERLGVKRYIPVEERELYEESADKAPWCPLVPKTDEERVQNCLGRLEKHLTQQIVITRKMDGTSVTYIWLLTKDGGKFMVCNRNNHLLVVNGNSRVYFEMAKRFDIEEKLKKLGRNLAFQGEITGPKINGNRHGLDDFELHIFNIYDIDAGCYLGWDAVVELCRVLVLNNVPEVYRGPVLEQHRSIDELQKIATCMMDNGRPYEGIVLKTLDYPRFSCKCISNEYMLKYGL